MDCSPPGSSVLGISQARILEWFAFWLHWVFAAVRRLSVVAANRDYSLVEVQGLLLLQSTGSQ